jgi:hypothetical protein
VTLDLPPGDPFPAEPAREPGSTSPRSPADPWAHRRGEPRTFAAAWILFLFAVAVIALAGVGVAGLVSVDVYRSASRVMMVAAGAGIGLVWPMLRLSQEVPARPVRAMGHDLLLVTLPVVAMVLPQSLPWMAGWPVLVSLVLAANLSAWALLLSGLLAIMLGELARRPGLPRWALMALLVLLVLGVPLRAVGRPARLPEGAGPAPPDPLLLASPVTAPLEVLADRGWTGRAAVAQPAHAWSAAIIAGAGLLAWGGAWRLGREQA